MIVTPPDYAAFAAAVGIPYPSDPQQQAQLAPVVAQWKADQRRQQEESRPSNAINALATVLGVGGLAAGGLLLGSKAFQPSSAASAAPLDPASPAPPGAAGARRSPDALQRLQQYVPPGSRPTSETLRHTSVMPGTVPRGANEARIAGDYKIASPIVRKTQGKHPQELRDFASLSREDQIATINASSGPLKAAYQEILGRLGNRDLSVRTAKSEEKLSSPEFLQLRYGTIVRIGDRAYMRTDSTGDSGQKGAAWKLVSPDVLVNEKFGNNLAQGGYNPDGSTHLSASYSADFLPDDSQGLIADPKSDKVLGRIGVKQRNGNIKYGEYTFVSPNAADEGLLLDNQVLDLATYKGGEGRSEQYRRVFTQLTGRPLALGDLIPDKNKEAYVKENKRDFVTDLDTPEGPRIVDYAPDRDEFERPAGLSTAEAARDIASQVRGVGPAQLPSAISAAAGDYLRRRYGPTFVNAAGAIPPAALQELTDATLRIMGEKPVAPQPDRQRLPLQRPVGSTADTLANTLVGAGLLRPASGQHFADLVSPKTYGTEVNPGPAFDLKTREPVIAPARAELADLGSLLSRLPASGDATAEAKVSIASIAAEIAAHDLPHVIHRGLMSADPLVRAAAENSLGAGLYGGVPARGALQDAFTRALRPFVGLTHVSDEAAIGKTPRYDIPVDASERMALKVLNGASLGDLLNEKIKDAPSIYHAVNALDEPTRKSSSKNKEQPNVAASHLVQNYFKTATADDGTQLGRLVAAINGMSNFGDGATEIERRTVAMALGSRFHGLEVMPRGDVSDYVRTATSAPNVGSDDIPANAVSSNGKKPKFAEVMTNYLEPDQLKAFPLNGEIRREYDSLTEQILQSGLPEAHPDNAQRREDQKRLVGEQIDLFRRRPDIEGVIHNYNSRVFNGEAQWGLASKTGFDGYPVRIVDLPRENISFGTAAQHDEKIDTPERDSVPADAVTAPAGEATDGAADGSTSDRLARFLANDTIRPLPDTAPEVAQLANYNEAAAAARREAALAAPGARPLPVASEQQQRLGEMMALLQLQRRQSAGVGNDAEWTPAAGHQASTVAMADQERVELQRRAAATAAIMDERVRKAASAGPNWLSRGVSAPGEAYLQARMKVMAGQGEPVQPAPASSASVVRAPVEDPSAMADWRRRRGGR